MQKLNYEAPQSDMLIVAAEQGFAASASSPEIPEAPGGDESEDLL